MDLVMERLASGELLTLEGGRQYPYRAISECVRGTRGHETSAYNCLNTRGPYPTTFELELLMNMLSRSYNSQPVTGADILLSYIEVKTAGRRALMGYYGRRLKGILQGASFQLSINTYIPGDERIDQALALIDYMQWCQQTEGKARSADESDLHLAKELGVSEAALVMAWSYVMTSIYREDWSTGAMPRDYEGEVSVAVYSTAVYIGWVEKMAGLIKQIFTGHPSLQADVHRREASK